MSAPSKTVRSGTYHRDGARCVSCGASAGLQYQHRRAVGMGGSKRRPAYPDGVTSCGTCNDAYEGSLQTRALTSGWKVRRFVRDPAGVPVWYFVDQCWYVLDAFGGRTQITRREACKMFEQVYGTE